MPTMTTQDVERELGAHDARLSRMEEDWREARPILSEIRDAVARMETRLTLLHTPDTCQWALTVKETAASVRELTGFKNRVLGIAAAISAGMGFLFSLIMRLFDHNGGK